MGHLRLIILILTLMIVFASCKKFNGPIRTGKYKGIFTVEYTSGTQSAETTVTLKEADYSCNSGVERIPAGGSGTYTVEDNKIKFTDENIWTAEFDWGLILNGEYDYTYDGTDLIIWKETQEARYVYDLNRK